MIFAQSGILTKEQERHKEYYVENKERLLDYQREYRAKNEDMVKEKTRAYNQGRKEKIAQYYDEHKEKILKTRKERHAYKKKYNPGYKYVAIKESARKRKLLFELSLDDYLSFWGKPCGYCAGKTINGLDRIDNDVGYTMKNVISCCYKCNRMKGVLSQKEFIAQCKLINNKYS